MKIRNGFVSNSSSSSFIIIGMELDREVGLKEIANKFYDVTADTVAEYCKTSVEELEDWDWEEYFYNKLNGYKKESYVYYSEAGKNSESVFGYLVASSCSDGDDLCDFEVTSEDITKVSKHMSEKLGIDPSKIRVMGGTRSC